MIKATNEIWMNFKTRTTRKEGAADLYIRVKFNGMDNTINTGVRVDIAKWNKFGPSGFFASIEGMQAKTQALEVQSLLMAMKAQGVSNIEDVKAQVCAISESQDKQTLDRIHKELEAQKYKSIIRYYKRFYSEIESGERTHGNNFKEYTRGTLKVWRGFGVLLVEFLNNSEAETFDGIDEQFANKFVKFMKGKHYMAKTISKNTTCFRKLCNAAVKDGVIRRDSEAPSVWGDIVVKEEQKRTEIYLTEEELDSIYNLELTGTREIVRDLFYLGYQSGQRFSDYNNLTKDNILVSDGITMLHLFQKKTGNEVYVPVTDGRVMAIFKKYNYRLPMVSEQQLNTYIKQVCELVSDKVRSLKEKYPTILTAGEKSKEDRFKGFCKRVAKGEKLDYNETREYNKGKRYAFSHGIIDGSLWERNSKGEAVKFKYELVTSHTARRSKATNMYLDGRLDTDSMMSITGHEKREIFEEYIKVQKLERAKMIAKKLAQGNEPIMRIAK